jgi:CubicO group peptidase (beta-lactamase class C family)
MFLTLSNELIDIRCRKEYLTGVAKRYPVHLSSTTPTYSNAAFAILAFALESITNQSFVTMLNDKLLTPLRMNYSSLFVPTIWGDAVILPTDTNASLWSSTNGPEAPYVKTDYFLANIFCSY